MFRTKKNKLKFLPLPLLCFALLLVWSSPASMQNPVFDVNIDQDKLLAGKYTHQQVLQAGGQFWTTPYTRYDALSKAGDGYGEGALGPRHLQRKAFNPSGAPGGYPFLRLNGLDSQSCYECHNSIGSDSGYGASTPLIRKQPSSVGGSAGSNSNAFINPCFPNPITLFIRQPPHVFGSGYIQTIGDEITTQLYTLRKQARLKAISTPNVQQSVRLIDAKRQLDYGVFKTTYRKGSKNWTLVGTISDCPATTCGVPNPPPGPPVLETDPGDVKVAGFTDDVSLVKGISADLVVRPFQWKGVASSLRHFVRDALDFHLSMQADEKVGDCDCDADGKKHEVSRGNVSAITAFVGMTRPPQQIVPPGVSEGSVKRGYEIFTGVAANAKLSGQMCATCHRPSLQLSVISPKLIIDDPIGNPAPNCKVDCPLEATGSYTSLVSPLRSHAQLPVLKRIQAKVKATGSKNLAADLSLVADPTYSIPLDSTDVPASSLPRLTQTEPFFLHFLPQPPPPQEGLSVPLFSDLQTHDMGRFLVDLVPQGSDVSGICLEPRFFLTRPLWGVADTGPWLHDGRATSLMEAILMHGDSATGSGSEARMIIDAFEKLSDADKQNVVNFLLSLRLPVESQGLTASR
jgi:hypothetical protein